MLSATAYLVYKVHLLQMQVGNDSLNLRITIFSKVESGYSSLDRFAALDSESSAKLRKILDANVDQIAAVMTKLINFY